MITPDDITDKGNKKMGASMGVLGLGANLYSLCNTQSTWSQVTFGSDEERGPIGPLKHLAKEAVEAQQSPGDIEEYADCLLLIIDASRRAGFDIAKLITAAQDKQIKNINREWPVSKPDEPVEHLKEPAAVNAYLPQDDDEKITAEWLGTVMKKHPDFGWFSEPIKQEGGGYIWLHATPYGKWAIYQTGSNVVFFDAMETRGQIRAWHKFAGQELREV